MIFNAIIPLPYYTPIFYNTVLVLVFFAILKLISKSYVIKNTNKKEYTSLMLFLLVLLYMGLRPISAVFLDMISYNNTFENYAFGAEISSEKDVIWHVFMKFCLHVFVTFCSRVLNIFIGLAATFCSHPIRTFDNRKAVNKTS